VVTADQISVCLAGVKSKGPSNVPLDAPLDFSDGDGGSLPWRPEASPPTLPPLQHHTAGRFIAAVLLLPPLAAAAWSLWLLASDVLGALDATLALSGVFLLAVVVSPLAGQGIGGRLMLIGWGAAAALIWGVVGRAIWALAAGG
jgi:hypothetical protein